MQIKEFKDPRAEIDRLTAECERLREEEKHHRECATGWHDKYLTSEAKCERLREENERLDTERAPAGAVKTWMKQWATENDRAVKAEAELSACKERVRELFDGLWEAAKYLAGLEENEAAEKAFTALEAEKADQLTAGQTAKHPESEWRQIARAMIEYAACSDRD